jgi:hypothetical protein
VCTLSQQALVLILAKKEWYCRSSLQYHSTNLEFHTSIRMMEFFVWARSFAFPIFIGPVLERRLSEDDDFSYVSDAANLAQSDPPNKGDFGLGSATSFPVSQGESQTRPFLSPSAEAELFLLASNFLLCKLKPPVTSCCCLRFLPYRTDLFDSSSRCRHGHHCHSDCQDLLS